jgi:hypothetical protein
VLHERTLPTLNEIKDVTTLTNDQCKNLLVTLANENVKFRMKDSSNYVSMFGVIFACLSDEGADMAKEHSSWVDANTTKNPLKLINIIKIVHSIKLQNIDNAEAQYIVMHDQNVAWNESCRV